MEAEVAGEEHPEVQRRQATCPDHLTTEPKFRRQISHSHLNAFFYTILGTPEPNIQNCL